MFALGFLCVTLLTSPSIDENFVVEKPYFEALAGLTHPDNYHRLVNTLGEKRSSKYKSSRIGADESGIFIEIKKESKIKIKTYNQVNSFDETYKIYKNKTIVSITLINPDKSIRVCVFTMVVTNQKESTKFELNLVYDGKGSTKFFKNTITRASIIALKSCIEDIYRSPEIKNQPEH